MIEADTKPLRYHLAPEVSPLQQLRRYAALALALQRPPHAVELELGLRAWQQLYRAMRAWVRLLLPARSPIRDALDRTLRQAMPACRTGLADHHLSYSPREAP